MPISTRVILLAITTIYHAIATYLENQQPPPGKLIDVGGYHLYLWVSGSSSLPTIVLDHSLGGIDGYFLIDELAKITRVCIYDRPGYGWSDTSPLPRTSENIVRELDRLLVNADIRPPYILIGNSFGSYNVRLYAHHFPEKVVGMVLTDGLEETGMLKMSILLQALKLFFLSGFLMSVCGSFLGIIRILNNLGLFEILKPELRKFPVVQRRYAKRSFCRSPHWLTMAQEIMNLNQSSHQVAIANQFHTMPIVNIKASSFFKPSLWTKFIPLSSANRLRDQMHLKLSNLSSNCVSLPAENSGHFVWLDRPDVIIEAVKIILTNI